MDEEEIRKILGELKIEAETKDPKKLAAEIAYNCVRNNTIIEDIHAGETMPDKYYADEPMYSRISQQETMVLMMEITKNIETALENKMGFFTMLVKSKWGMVPTYWKAAPSSPMIVSPDEDDWRNEIFDMSDEEWAAFYREQ